MSLCVIKQLEATCSHHQTIPRPWIVDVSLCRVYSCANNPCQTRVPFEATSVQHDTPRLANWPSRVAYHGDLRVGLEPADVVSDIVNEPLKLFT